MTDNIREISTETANAFRDMYEGDTHEGWTCVADEHIDNSRWMSINRKILTDEVGEHWAWDYQTGLTEYQDDDEVSLEVYRVRPYEVTIVKYAKV